MFPHTNMFTRTPNTIISIQCRIDPFPVLMGSPRAEEVKLAYLVADPGTFSAHLEQPWIPDDKNMTVC